MKKLLSLLLAAVIALSAIPVPAAAAAESRFADVPANEWYAADVEFACDSGLFRGVSDTRFEPNGTLRLSEAVTLAARTAQYLNEGAVTLQNGSEIWYSTYVDYAKANGIVGTEYDGRWTDVATRYEMVEIFAAIPGIDTAQINTVDDGAIPDVAIGGAHAPAVYRFYRAGILTGGDGNLFQGDTDIARCQVAAILSRLIDADRRLSVTLRSAKTPPDRDTALTEESLLALLDACDPDGAWIIRHAEGTGTSWKIWAGGASTLGELSGRLGTVVHEQLHGYTGSAGWKQEYIYVGNGNSVTVSFTDVFDTAEMAAEIPEGLRTFRYDDYVSPDAEPAMASRQFGPYGLLNEYAAYCWGMNNDLRTADYFGDSPYSTTNTYVAFMEFRFYILRYMLYAKEHHPAVYQGVLNNASFREAFSAIDATFAPLVEAYRASKPYLSQGRFDQEYQALAAVVDTPEYQEMLRLLQP